MSERHIDGNGVAGLLAQVLAVETTTVMRTCQSCADRRPLAAHRAYRGAGIVLRCPSCGDVGLRIGVHASELTVEWRGTFGIALDPGAGAPAP